MARRPDRVARVETGAGVRYEARVHAQRGDGSRFQRTRRFATVEAAVAWHSKITSGVSAGTHIAPSPRWRSATTCAPYSGHNCKATDATT